jgi:hypothetical protein
VPPPEEPTEYPEAPETEEKIFELPAPDETTGEPKVAGPPGEKPEKTGQPKKLEGIIEEIFGPENKSEPKRGPGESGAEKYNDPTRPGEAKAQIPEQMQVQRSEEPGKAQCYKCGSIVDVPAGAKTPISIRCTSCGTESVIE